jgi:hypothetical protein
LAKFVQVCPAKQAGLFCAPSAELHITDVPVPVHELRGVQNEANLMYAALQHTSPPLQSLGPSQSSSNSFPVRAHVVPVGACGWHALTLVPAS